MRGQVHDVRWIEAYASGAAIPAFGLCKIVGAELEDPGRLVLHVEAPSQDNDYPLAINSWKPIAAGDYGLVTLDGPAFVLYTGQTPEVGYAYGAASGSFYATQDKTGLLILGGEDTDRSIVLVDICKWNGYIYQIMFTLAEQLEDTDENVTATIEEQIGPGMKSPYTGAGEIVVHNLPRDDGGYEYYGDTGHYGTAYWLYGNHYRVDSLQCPP